jgi:hypothetical protein
MQADAASAADPTVHASVAGPDFIGLGAQRSGTSWIYACLYEHSGVHIPVKEIHFFSREHHWSRGYGWYEEHFAGRPSGARVGEFSTSYLADPAAPARIHRRYPDARLIVSLRNPVERAYSNFRNDLMAGTVRPGTPFETALAAHPEYVSQGRYFAQLAAYLRLFPRRQMLVLIYEDSLSDPLAFIQSIYRFIGVDGRFAPSMLRTRVNEGRVPHFSLIDRALSRASAVAKTAGLERVWWLLKRQGVGQRIRALNTRGGVSAEHGPGPEQRRALFARLEDDIRALETLLGRELTAWRP